MTTKQDETRTAKPKPAKAKPQPAEKVPNWAEDMEHDLRRLAREKEERRAKNPGLYR